MQKTILGMIVVAVLVGGVSFYSGMQFGQSRTPRGLTRGDSSAGGGSAFGGQSLRNLSPEERQARLQQMGMPAGTGFRGGQFGNRNAVNFAAGEIISQDEKSITVKLRDGGSKIIFYSGQTEVGKFASGTPADLEVGKSVSVNGTANADGSLTAESIQIRPPGTGVPPRSGPPSSDVSP